MKKRSILNLVAVKTPCTKDWDLMYGNDEVRFCEHCVKHVHDLSAMTRRDAEKFVAGAKGSICVRYIRRPDGKMQTAGDKLYQISARASRLAAGVFGTSLTLASSVYSQGDITNTVPAQEQAAVKPDTQKNKALTAKGSDAIFGTVTDQNGAVVPGTEVILTDQQTEATQTVRSGDDGSYAFATVAEGTYKLEFKSTGFVTLTIVNINYKDRANEKIDAVFQAPR